MSNCGVLYSAFWKFIDILYFPFGSPFLIHWQGTFAVSLFVTDMQSLTKSLQASWLASNWLLIAQIELVVHPFFYGFHSPPRCSFLFPPSSHTPSIWSSTSSNMSCNLLMTSSLGDQNPLPLASNILFTKLRNASGLFFFNLVAISASKTYVSAAPSKTLNECNQSCDKMTGRVALRRLMRENNYQK